MARTSARKPGGAAVRIEAHDRAYEIEATGIVGRCAAQGVPYEARLLEWIYEQKFSGLALDVGAHVGNHSLYMAAICALDVVAFEPTKNVRDLRRNVSLNELEERITVHRVALGREHAIGKMVGKGQVDPDWRSMTQELKLGDGELEIQTLDSFQLEDVAVIKVDVEGMEADVLAGGLLTIERDRPVIYAETWGDDYTRSVGEVLAPLGYEVTNRIRTATPVQEWRCR